MGQLLCIFPGLISQQEHCARYQTLCTSLYHSVSLDFSAKNSHGHVLYVPAAMCLAFGIISIQAFGFEIILGVQFLGIFLIVPVLLCAMWLSSKFANNSAGSPNLNVNASNKL